jgi:hypothetical protein
MTDRDQLTEAEATQLEALLTRRSLDTVVGALGILCEKKRASLIMSGRPGATAWAAASVILLRAETSIRRIGQVEGANGEEMPS